MMKEIILANFKRIIELFTPKIVNKLSKIWVWNPGPEGSEIRDPRSGIRDPGSEIRDPEKTIPDSGSRGQKGTGSLSPDPRSRSATLSSRN
jgi:hypothetical protein